MSNTKQSFRMRVRIAGPGADWGAVEADTHPHLPQEAPLDDTLIVHGLRDVLELAADLIQQHHGRGDDIDGATRRDLRSRLGTVRVYLSVHRGRAGINIPYTLDNERVSGAYLMIEYGERLHMPHVEEERAERARDVVASVEGWAPPATVRVRPSDLPPKEPSK